jgi:DNA-binding MarR family transcriptional regulator
MARPLKERPDVQVFAEIAIVDQLVTNRLERVLPVGLSHAQFNVLTWFAHRGGEASPAELAGVFQVTKGAMTNTLQRLEAQGLVEVDPDPVDGRRKRVRVTHAGRRTHEQALVSMRPLHESLRSAFTDAEFVAALPFLRALRTWLDETR